MRYNIYNYEHIEIDDVRIPIVVKCEDEDGHLHRFTQLEKMNKETAGDTFVTGGLDLVYLRPYKIANNEAIKELPNNVVESLSFLRENIEYLLPANNPRVRRKQQQYMDKLNILDFTKL